MITWGSKEKIHLFQSKCELHMNYKSQIKFTQYAIGLKKLTMKKYSSLEKNIKMWKLYERSKQGTLELKNYTKF